MTRESTTPPIRSVRLAFVELDYHAEVLEKSAEIFDHPSIEPSFFTRADIAAKVGSEQKKVGTWHIAGRAEPAASFLGRHLGALRHQDAVIFNTLASNFWLVSALPLNVPLYLRVHNVNATFAPMRSLAAPTSALLAWKTFSHAVRRELLRQDWVARRLVLARLTGVLFPSTTMLESAKRLGVPPHLRCACLPLAAFQPHAPVPSLRGDGGPVFCIPGAVDARRRDYELVLAALEIVARASAPLTVCFLGRPVGKAGREIVLRAQALARGALDVVTFDAFVHADDFDRWLFGASALVAPTKRDARYTIFTEAYGTTKISGTETDAVRAGKPCIFPSWYQPDAGIAEASRFFEDAEGLAAEWLRWLDPSYRARLEAEAVAARGQHDAATLVNRFVAEILPRLR